MEDEIQRYLADFPQIFSFDKQRELISQFKFLLNQAKAEKFGTQCDDAWSCLGPVLKIQRLYTNKGFMDGPISRGSQSKDFTVKTVQAGTGSIIWDRPFSIWTRIFEPFQKSTIK